LGTTDCYWSLYNIQTKIRIDGLKTIQARAVALSITPQLREHWLVWKEGLPNWASLSAYPELADTSLRLPTPPPFPPALHSTAHEANKPDGGDYHIAYVEHDSDPGAIVDLQIDEVAYKDLRAHARFIKHFPITVVVNGVSHRATTENMSMGGIKIKDSLPHEVSGHRVKVVISRPDGTLELLCHAVPNPSEKGVNRLIITENPNAELYRKWLF
jgi:hypothetical protein